MYRLTPVRIIHLFVALSLVAPPLLLAQVAPVPAPVAPPPIRDNSFLIEEAYNQEKGVVQHISAFMIERDTDAWSYNFTQEWPLGSEKHQLSFTLPVETAGSGPSDGRGIGDVALNYRYQLLSGSAAPLAIAPRVSIVLPTGDTESGRGAGGTGLQLNLPVSLTLGSALVTHVNAGLTLTSSANNSVGDEASTRDYWLGQSVIWLVAPVFNVMLEALWVSAEEVIGPDQRVRTTGAVISPGVRGAFNFASGLQIVPGIAIPIGIGPSRGERSLFLYLSFEHPFDSPAKH